VDILEGTVFWEYNPMACSLMIVQLYKGLMKVYTNQMYTNQTNTFKGRMVVVEHKDKDQAGG
jgi:hypothetical protein